MKSNEPDPPRLAGRGDPELARLVRASRIRRLNSQTTAQMFERLAATNTYAAATRAATPRPSLRGSVGATKLAVLVLLGLGAATFRWTRSVEPPAPPPSDATTQAIALAPASTVAPASPNAVEVASIPVEALPSSAQAVVAASSPPRTVAPRTSSPARASTPTEARALLSRENEFALVRRAEDVLASDPSRTLALVEEHFHAYPTGELVQEREVLAVEALARLNRMVEAKERADALRVRYPRTPYGVRLRRALGEPSSPVPSKSPY